MFSIMKLHILCYLFRCQLQEGPSDSRDLWQSRGECKGILFMFVISNHDCFGLNFLNMYLCSWTLLICICVFKL